MNNTNPETRITFKTPSHGLSKRQAPKVITKFKAPSLIRTTDERPPTQYSSVVLPPTQHTFKHTHTVKIESDWLAIVFLPSIISLLMLMVLAFTALTSQDTSPIDPAQVTDVKDHAEG